MGFPRYNSTATYSVDGEEPVEFDVMGLPSNIDEALYYFPLFETPPLSQGEHTLEVVHKGPGAPLVFEYFLIDNGDIVQPEGLVLEFNDSNEPYPPNPSRPGGRKKSPTSAIIGGAVAGIVVLSIIAILLYFYMKRKKSNSPKQSFHPDIVHSPMEPNSHLPLLPSTPTAQVHSSTNFLPSPASGPSNYSSYYSDHPSPSGPIMSVTPAASIPVHSIPQYVPPTITFTPPAQNASSSAQFTSSSSKAGMSIDPPQYEESPSGAPYPADVKRPLSGSNQPPAFLSAQKDAPYDLSLLGLSNRPSSHHPPSKG
jgi:hypothetical protein